jgi:hypothetical protein
VNDIVLVGLREWESDKKNVDVLYIYEENQVSLIQQNSSSNTDRIIEHNDMIQYDYSNECANVGITTEQEIEYVKDAFTDEIDLDNI